MLLTYLLTYLINVDTVVDVEIVINASTIIVVVVVITAIVIIIVVVSFIVIIIIRNVILYTHIDSDIFVCGRNMRF